ncbi:transmembrane protein 143-like [Carcharodon carcharias]|uniref:transmembrane protein 143-like n=1 Tax=Carcharodon carcharias TaxID=13397 RepID=UPI001B7EA419|nr:transmembrane protein 143-like [Carcharodon carcharias]
MLRRSGMLCTSLPLRAALGPPRLRAAGWCARAPGDGTRTPGAQPPIPGEKHGRSESTSDRPDVATGPEAQSGRGQLPKEPSPDYLERFIPFDKHVLQHMLLKELSSASEEDRASLTTLVEQAEAETTQDYQATLERLLALFEPINPDRDTLPVMVLTEPVQLDQEMVLLDNLGPVLEQANFNALSEETIQYALSCHDPLFKSQVTVRVENYEYMKFWALGVRLGAPPMEMKEKLQSSKRWFFWIKVKAPMHRRYCKRVVMAARLKGGRLVLKSFKDIPLENLEHLLPAVQMRFSLRDRTFISFTLLAGGSALFANLTVLGLYSLKVDFLLLLLLFATLMVHRSQRLFQRRRDHHALNHANTLYTKSTSNNGELLVSLVRRAHQEHLKELMLAHAFRLLLRQRQPQRTPSDGAEVAALLSGEVSAWLRERSGLPIAFRGTRALTHLQGLERQLSQR